MVIDKNILDNLTVQAKSSPCLRQVYDLRNTPEDGSQRMLNALEPGTVMPIHRHLASSETVVLLRGRICWHFYDDAGNKGTKGRGTGTCPKPKNQEFTKYTLNCSLMAA